jgi:hypothetical protein
MNFNVKSQVPLFPRILACWSESVEFQIKMVSIEDKMSGRV